MHVKEKGKIANKKYQEITKISRQLAAIELTNAPRQSHTNQRRKGVSTVYEEAISK